MKNLPEVNEACQEKSFEKQSADVQAKIFKKGVAGQVELLLDQAALIRYNADELKPLAVSRAVKNDKCRRVAGEISTALLALAEVNLQLKRLKGENDG